MTNDMWSARQTWKFVVVSLLLVLMSASGLADASGDGITSAELMKYIPESLDGMERTEDRANDFSDLQSSGAYARFVSADGGTVAISVNHNPNAANFFRMAPRASSRPVPVEGRKMAVFYTDAQTGWLIMEEIEADGSAATKSVIMPNDMIVEISLRRVDQGFMDEVFNLLRLDELAER